MTRVDVIIGRVGFATGKMPKASIGAGLPPLLRGVWPAGLVGVEAIEERFEQGWIIWEDCK
ncbi:MAG: hypothetical protein PHW25_16580 [Zoogloea sp.]|uniref:hypothetical protein n=1 Tax=Zoogloea sp. TaxID=49181 RepID=UPI00261046A7|nr:hypothetical protein [Zoogloea sp.]MDD3328701.1 hypothetical protein [Zoogloea sp.]